jgi:hypothetical protein
MATRMSVIGHFLGADQGVRRWPLRSRVPLRVGVLGGVASCGSNDWLSAPDGRKQDRREWDSNPRYGCPYTRFPSVRLQPLGHPSTGRGEYRRRGFQSKQLCLRALAASRLPPRSLAVPMAAPKAHAVAPDGGTRQPLRRRNPCALWGTAAPAGADGHKGPGRRRCWLSFASWRRSSC